MIKVSKILKAMAGWLHAWLEPNGAIHDTNGESHGAWAYKNLRADERDLLREGWVRLGCYGSSAYLYASQPISDAMLHKAQIWIIENAPAASKILYDMESFKGSLDADDFLAVNRVQQLSRLAEPALV